MNQIQTFIQNHWISISRLKGGSSNHKAFFSKEGSRILNERKGDFKFLLYFKNDDSYIFTSDNKPTEPIRRETITKEINTALALITQQLDDQLNISSHSFRAGYMLMEKYWG